MHEYEVRRRKDHCGVDLISDVLRFGPVWYTGPNAIDYAKFRSRSHDAVIRVYDAAGNVIETHEHKGRFQRVVTLHRIAPESFLIAEWLVIRP
jgi:hypothetical protein